jgi:hypothetical protein
MGIALATTATAGDPDAITGAENLAQQDALGLAPRLSPKRNRDLKIVTAAPGAIGTQAVLAALGGHLRRVSQVIERIEILAGDQSHRATGTAIATGRSALGDELLPTERDAAVPTASGTNAKLDFVDERQGRRFRRHEGAED